MYTLTVTFSVRRSRRRSAARFISVYFLNIPREAGAEAETETETEFFETYLRVIYACLNVQNVIITETYINV